MLTTTLLTAATLIAFAANSLLCRMALGEGTIDPISFTTLRLVSGALVLIPISRVLAGTSVPKNSRGSWRAGFALFAYALGFSLAYVSLSTGTGALILFATVQVTMIGAALVAGEKLRPVQWVGASMALGGLIYLVLPGISAPDPVGATLMCVAGAAWGVYSLLGRGTRAPVAMTAGNFLRSAPMAIAVSAIALGSVHLETPGVLLALLSGMLTSGMGYILWYTALRRLTTPQASIVQLLVPVLAAFGGVAFLAEHVSARLVIASALILGGVALGVWKGKAA
ncbi:MAG: DMT family transporter [Anaerolineales bacterium]|nr:MAG: DMT family transporter [Anaerolineales bacterium]